jgi:tape measure domain-containing protein
MADAAQLKLQVGLDLAFFRQQLALLGTTAVGYSLPIEFDRLGVQKEITKLGENIRRRNYKLEIKTNIEAETAKVATLANSLKNLEGTQVNVQITGTGELDAKEARKIRTALRSSVLANGGKIKIPTTITAAITLEDVAAFKRAVKSKLDGLSVNVKANVKGGGAGTGYPDLMKYMAEEGLLGKTASGMTGQMGKSGNDIKQQLNDAVQSAQKIKSIFDGVAQSIATTGKSTATIQGKKLGLANVPLMVGGVEKKIERSTAAIGGTTSSDALKALYPEVSKTITSLAALKGQIQQNTSKLSGFSLIIALAAFAGVPLAKSVVKLTGSADNFAKLLDELGLKLDAAFTKAASSILSAASSRLLGGGSVAGLLPPAYRGIGPSAGLSGLLPPAYRGLPPAYRGIGPSAGAAGLLSPAYRGIQPSAGAAGLLPPAYRGIGPSRNAGAIGGTAFGSQKLLPSALGDETIKILRDAAHAFLNVMRQEMRAVVYQVGVQDLGNRIGRQAMLSGRNIAGLLPPGVGRVPNAYTTGAIGGETQTERFARREREARIRSSFREMDVMGGGGGRTAASYNYAYRAARPTSAIIPYGPGGALVAGGGGGGGNVPPRPPTPSASPGGGRGGFNGFAGMAGMQLPGANLVRELGDQFGYATQQVLLFGAAYKALAFLTDFPAQVGNAVGALQTYRNTLKNVTNGGEEFSKSNQFILDLVERYNVPLQSARDGFTKLYASMAPAGFKGDEIRNIFAGISQGAATFGMSADKVDRVNYAFAQMASKGQVMSEELKGQLGDVLPGSVAIFAEAAGFTGPEALVKFTKAMEDGRYKGAAMKQLLINVGTVMNKEFGPGAEGAARTFQGLMNRMQNATLKLYEAFEPMAIGFANKVVLPMTEGLKVAADGFNAFFTGQQAVTKGGAELATKLQELRPTFEGLATNAKAVADRVIDLSKAFVPLLELGAKLLATPLAGFLAQTYVSVLLLNSAFTALGGRFAVTSMVAYFSRLNTALVLTQAQMIATGGAANAMSLRILAAGSTSVGAASATTQLTLALRAMWVAMTGPVGLGVAALAAVTAAAYLMNKPFKEYVDSIPDRFAGFWRDLQSQATASISKVIKMWDSLATATSETFRLMMGSVSGFYDGLVAQLGPIAPWFGGMMQWLKNAWIETIAFMVNQSSPVLGIAKTLGVDVGKTLMVNLTKDRNLPAPGQFTPAGGVSFDAQGNPIGASLSPFIPGGGALSPIPGATGDDSRGSAAKDAKRIAEQIKQQLKSAQDLKFEQQNRLTLLRAENDFTKAFTSFSIQRLEIERRYTELLKQSMSPEETAALQQARSAEYKQSSLTLQQQINDLLKQAQAPLNDAVESIKNQVAFEREYGELIKNGTNPEVAKQILAIRKAYNESVKLLEPALAAAQAAVTKAKAEGASATEIQKYREQLEKIEAIRKGLEGKKAEGEAAAIDSNKPKTPTEAIEGRISTLKAEIAELTNIGNIAIKVADGIGAAFGQAFEGLITGSMSAQEALGNFFKSIGNMFIQMAAEIIAKQMTMIVLGFLMKALGLTAGIGSAGNAAGAAAFSPGNSSAFQAIPGQAFSMPKLAANGATFSNGIAKFATGGIVNGPTLFPFADGGAMQMGLMGEAGPEAILPLQRGSDGSLGVRAAMGGNGMGGSSSPVLSMSFETSTINGVEYVSRDQLEAAMAQTRRQASSDGAKRGMAMTLDKIQQSPQTRRRIGM